MNVMTGRTLASLAPHEALPRIMREHGTFVFAICLAYCGDEDLARDLTQETFLRAYGSWETFEGRSSVSTWLYTIARRTCSRLQRCRAGEPRRRVDLESIGERFSAADAVPEWDYAGFDPLEHLIEEETTDLVRRAIAHLPIRYRLPLVLKELAGLSVYEVAGTLHLSEGTVKSRLFRARALLETELEPARDSSSTTSADGNGGSAMTHVRPPSSANGWRAADAHTSVRSDTLCPNCRTVFETEALATRICDSLLDGENSPLLASILLREHSTDSNRHALTATSHGNAT